METKNFFSFHEKSTSSGQSSLSRFSLGRTITTAVRSHFWLLRIHFEFLFIVRKKGKYLPFISRRLKKILHHYFTWQLFEGKSTKMTDVPQGCSSFMSPFCPILSSWRKYKASDSLSWKHIVHPAGWDGNLLYAARKDTLYNTDLQLLTWKLNRKGNSALLCFPSNPKESNTYFVTKQSRQYFILP